MQISPNPHSPNTLNPTISHQNSTSDRDKGFNSTPTQNKQPTNRLLSLSNMGGVYLNLAEISTQLISIPVYTTQENIFFIANNTVQIKQIKGDIIMNTYLVPILWLGQKDSTDLMIVYADSEDEAYRKVVNRRLHFYKIQNPTETHYEMFKGQLSIPSLCFNEYTHFPVRIKDDVIKYYMEKEGLSMTGIDLYNYMYFGDYNAQIQSLAKKALNEKWSFEGKNDNAILKNYLENTFIQLQKEDKIVETDSYCLFNTGLFTEHYVPIYTYGEPNKKYNDNQTVQKWFFRGFKDEYDLSSLDIDVDFPERADYFKDTTLLVFDYHCKIHVNYAHILEDLNTSKRLPACVKNSERPLESLKGYIDTAIQRVTANYKLAVPHYYQNKIQLMIPLCFSKNNVPDVALVLDKRKGNHYQAKTCLTMEMAYMDARLIARPESNWLVAENITSTEKDLDTEEIQ